MKIPLCCTGHYYLCVKIESDDGYHCLRKMILKGDCQPRIYFSLQGGKKGGLCFNDLNSLKLNHVHEMPIQTTSVCFKF